MIRRRITEIGLIAGLRRMVESYFDVRFILIDWEENIQMTAGVPQDLGSWSSTLEPRT